MAAAQPESPAIKTIKYLKRVKKYVDKKTADGHQNSNDVSDEDDDADDMVSLTYWTTVASLQL